MNVRIPDAVCDTPGELVSDVNALSEALGLMDTDAVPVDVRKLLFDELTEARGDALSRILGEDERVENAERDNDDDELGEFDKVANGDEVRDGGELREDEIDGEIEDDADSRDESVIDFVLSEVIVTAAENVIDFVMSELNVIIADSVAIEDGDVLLDCCLTDTDGGIEMVEMREDIGVLLTEADTVPWSDAVWHVVELGD